jgi:hypothetical protein
MRLNRKWLSLPFCPCFLIFQRQDKGGIGMNPLRQIFAKTLLSWDEPRAFLRTRHSHGGRRLRRVLLATVATGILLAWGARIWFPGIHLAGFHGALASILIIVLLTYWTGRGIPSRIRITETAIIQTVADDAHSTWLFADIHHCEIISTRVADTLECVLIIELKRGKRATLGITPTVSLTSLQNLLESRDISVSTSYRDRGGPSEREPLGTET